MFNIFKPKCEDCSLRKPIADIQKINGPGSPVFIRRCQKCFDKKQAKDEEINQIFFV